MGKDNLLDLYFHRGYSMAEIASIEQCSVHKVNYWFAKYGIPRRTRSEALYKKYNRDGDPFVIKKITSIEDSLLYGLGVGIYWGEGNKRCKNAVRVGNTDPGIIQTFVKFLVSICGVKYEKIRYGLQVFSDVEESDALSYWQNRLNISRDQIMPTVNRIKSGKIGTYKHKNQFGVMTVYVYNTKLRNWLVEQLVVPR